VEIVPATGSGGRVDIGEAVTANSAAGETVLPTHTNASAAQTLIRRQGVVASMLINRENDVKTGPAASAVLSPQEKVIAATRLV
jgi:hypothetical protein